MADPISFAVGSAVLSAGGTFAAASAISTAVFYAVTAAPFVAAGIQQARAADKLDGNFSTINRDEGLQQVVLESSPAWRLPLGRAVQTGRPYFAAGGQEIRPFFYYGFILSHEPCGALLNVIINNTIVSIDPTTGLAISTPFNDGATSFIEVAYQAGSPDQPINPILARDFPDRNLRFRNTCEVVIKAHYGTGGTVALQDDKHKELYGDSQFTPIFEHWGAKTYDPRKTTHILTDSSTWEPTQNATLNTMRYFWWKYPALRSYINWDLIAEAAEIDDRFWFDKNGRAYRRHTLSGTILDDEDAFEVVQSLLTSNDALFVRDRNGYYLMPTDDREQPISTITNEDLIGGIDYTRDVAFADVFNIATSEFFSRERDFQVVPAPTVIDQASIDQDGVERETNVPLVFTDYHVAAQRLTRRKLNKVNQRRSMALGVNMKAHLWRVGKTVRVELSGIQGRRVNGVYRILKKAPEKQRGGYSLVLQENPSSIHDYDPATQEQDFQETVAL